MKIVIRAGGSGTRLWPLSRKRQPKQFLPLLGKRSLLEEKIREIRPLFRRWENLYLSVGEPFVAAARRIAPHIPRENIIAEPCGRNTGPAIALESAVIEAAMRGRDDPVIASLTVDDVFRERGKFRDALRASEQFLHAHPLWVVALASRPPQPDDGASYIETGRALGTFSGRTFYTHRTWTQTCLPLPTIVRMLKRQTVFAHTGLYIWKTSTILSLFERHHPEIFRGIRTIQRAIGSRTFSRILRREYGRLPSISIEDAIARKVRNVAVVADDFHWSDTGKWYLVKHLLAEGAANVTNGEVVSVDSEDNLLYSAHGKMIGAIGLKGMVVVDTGDALLVCPKNRSGDLKQLLERIRERGLETLL